MCLKLQATLKPLENKLSDLLLNKHILMPVYLTIPPPHVPNNFLSHTNRFGLYVTFPPWMLPRVVQADPNPPWEGGLEKNSSLKTTHRYTHRSRWRLVQAVQWKETTTKHTVLYYKCPCKLLHSYLEASLTVWNGAYFQINMCAMDYNVIPILLMLSICSLLWKAADRWKSVVQAL